LILRSTLPEAAPGFFAGGVQTVCGKIHENLKTLRFHPNDAPVPERSEGSTCGECGEKTRAQPLMPPHRHKQLTASIQTGKYHNTSIQIMAGYLDKTLIFDL
jgi:hypothetical protein